MKYLKLFNESFMSDYQKLSDDFDRMKSEFQKNRLQLWNEHSLVLDQIFYDLEEYTNDFFSKYRSSTGGVYDNYLVFLENLFTKHYGDKNFYNQRLRNDNFFFDCMNQGEEGLLQFLESCLATISLFGQLHESFTLHLDILWTHKDKPLSGSGKTPTIPSEGMDEFIKNNLRKDDIELWKKSLVNHVIEMRREHSKHDDRLRGIVGDISVKDDIGLRALFYIQVK
jgi:hypothetical protein